MLKHPKLLAGKLPLSFLLDTLCFFLFLSFLFTGDTNLRTRYDKIVNGDKTGTLFRCDNPDIAVPNKGCSGEVVEESSTSVESVVPTSTATAAAVSYYSWGVEECASSNKYLQECHTHDDGVAHCT